MPSSLPQFVAFLHPPAPALARHMSSHRRATPVPGAPSASRALLHDVRPRRRAPFNLPSPHPSHGQPTDNLPKLTLRPSASGFGVRTRAHAHAPLDEPPSLSLLLSLWVGYRSPPPAPWDRCGVTTDADKDPFSAEFSRFWRSKLGADTHRGVLRRWIKLDALFSLDSLSKSPIKSVKSSTVIHPIPAEFRCRTALLRLQTLPSLCDLRSAPRGGR
ncbi:hypothetical protein DFH09DRAFT_393652 [Mycena vulgaris]|nr:hypothetical protein DFH09DRAFT_393652 [Mycena vulgaris]